MLKQSLAGQPGDMFVIECFRVSIRRRKIFKDDQLIHIGARAFDVLIALIEADGELVTKNELMKRVWPKTIVEEHNVEVQVSTLRKMLGDRGDIILTEAGRGYRLVAPVKAGFDPPNSWTELPGPASATKVSLSTPLSSLIGRARAVDALINLVSTHRLVTITGAGGVGKTRVATEIARLSVPSFLGGVHLLELAPVADAEQLTQLVEREMRASRSISDGRGDRLLVLDNCEHLVDATARLIDRLLRDSDGLHVLATSRECFAVEGEQVYPLAPLNVPADDDLSANEARQYSAVELFVDRARAIDPEFEMSDQIVPYVARICRCLDGVPLAIEFAAASVPAVGVRELAQQFTEGFQVLRGRRVAGERHKTLQSTFSWSYELLSAVEQKVLRCVSVFPGSFTVDAAAFVAGYGGEKAKVAAVIRDLHNKSLVVVDTRTSPPRYRLLRTTRAFALEKLQGSEIVTTSEFMARYYIGALRVNRKMWTAASLSEVVTRYGFDFENVRVALNRAFCRSETSRVGVELTVAAIPLWIALSELEECRNHVQRALIWLAKYPGENEREELSLQISLAMWTMWTKGPVKETEEALLRGLELAESLKTRNTDRVHTMVCGSIGSATADIEPL